VLTAHLPGQPRKETLTNNGARLMRLVTAKYRKPQNKALINKGLTLEQQNPDLLVRYATVTGRGTKTEFYSPYYGGFYGGWGYGGGWYRPWGLWLMAGAGVVPGVMVAGVAAATHKKYIIKKVQLLLT
jgi:hypothetical protein